MAHRNTRVEPGIDREKPDLSPQALRLAATFDRAYRARPSPRLDAAMMAAMKEAPSTKGSRVVSRPGHAFGTTHLRLAAVGAVLALVASGAAGFPRPSGSALVSAQTVLSHATAAMRLAPDEAAHLTYSVSTTPSADQTATPKDSMTAVADVWIEADANGVAAASSQTLAMALAQANLGSAAKDKAAGLHQSSTGKGVRTRPLDHYIQIGQQVYGYDRGNNAIVIPGSHNDSPGWMIPNAALDGTSVAQELRTLAQHSPRQVQLLPQQTLEGVAVDVIEVNGWAAAPGMRSTFYFDAQTYELRGFDAVSIDPAYPTASWQARLSNYSMIAATAIPPRTFTLNAPEDATIEPPHLDATALATDFATVCHSALDASQLEQILQAKQQSLLAACRETAPNTSREDLVAALIAPYTTTLASAETAVQVTQAQVGAAMAAQQQRLEILITTPGGGTTSN